MIDLGVCNVCRLRKAIGVASTSMPLSVAYCECCARYRADPEIVFVYWAESGITPDEHRCPGLSLTWRDGQYVTYREWHRRYAPVTGLA